MVRTIKKLRKEFFYSVYFFGVVKNFQFCSSIAFAISIAASLVTESHFVIEFMKSSRLITPSFHFIALSIWALSNAILVSQALLVTLIGVLLPAILRLTTSPTLHAVNPEFVLFHPAVPELVHFSLKKTFASFSV